MMGLRIFIENVDNGYVITKYNPDGYGAIDESRVAIDTADLFEELAVILDYDWTADAKRGGEVT